MITILITAFREPATIGRAIESFLPQLPTEAEILVVCPDPDTTAIVDDYAARHSTVQHVADPQKGKPVALNVGLKEARGDIVVLSDGDVYVGKDVLAPLLAPFKDPQVGAVSGRPVSTSPRDTLMGYWSYVLTEGVHQMRLKRDQSGRFLVCSGYLFAIRRELVEHVPGDALAEDAVISHLIARQGRRIGYAPEAQVFVKYPATYQDWLRQKVRSAGGYAQDYIRHSPVRMRSPWREIWYGTRLALRYPRHPREFLWTLLLFVARLHLWLLVLINVRILRRPFTKLWQRIESTK